MEAFACHPRIGESVADTSGGTVPGNSAMWSRQEQSRVQVADDAVRRAIAEGNMRYERQIGFTYIVCATGKDAEEMLAILEHRLSNDRATEIMEAAEQQRQITQLRLKKWLASGNITENIL